MWALLATSPAVLAQGGPPLITDDPDTPGPGHWEINIAAHLDKHDQERLFEAPRIDVNYGVGRRIQLKLEMPWLLARDSEGHRASGSGDMTAGVKWRFVGQEGQWLAWSVYPQLDVNTSRASVAKGLAEDGRRLLLPTEITIEFTPVEINVEVGREFAEHGADSWMYGLSTEGHVAPRLELLVEVHGERPDGEEMELVANGGARYKITRRLQLLLSAGRQIGRAAASHDPLLLYGGLQVNLPDLYSFDTPPASVPGPARAAAAPRAQR